MAKRGLIFCKYGPKAASTRQRFLQAAPYLEAAGITLDIRPLFDNAYLTRLFHEGQRRPQDIFMAYASRLRDLLRMRNYDFIGVYCELFPYLPGLLETLVATAGKPVLYDIDDAVFHQYDQHKNPLLRRMLAHKLEPLLTRCSLAFCGNAYLQSYVSRYCPRTEIIPTTVDTAVYLPAAAPRRNSTPTLGWIGSPSTWAYCLPMADLFSSFVQQGALSMRVIGAEHAADAHYPFTYLPWTEANEVADIQAMDIGIMPLPDEPWARGKCGYKLIQYMACGLPVIASPVGVNAEIVTHGVNGFLATSETEWRNAIDALSRDEGLRRRMGEAGRATVIERYSIAQVGPRMADLIHTL